MFVLTCYSEVNIAFQNLNLSEFQQHLEDEFKIFSEKGILVLLPFSIAQLYLREAGISVYTDTKTTHRNSLNVKPGICLPLSPVEPKIRKL